MWLAGVVFLCVSVLALGDRCEVSVRQLRVPLNPFMSDAHYSFNGQHFGVYGETVHWEPKQTTRETRTFLPAPARLDKEAWSGWTGQTWVYSVPSPFAQLEDRPVGKVKWLPLYDKQSQMPLQGVLVRDVLSQQEAQLAIDWFERLGAPSFNDGKTVSNRVHIADESLALTLHKRVDSVIQEVTKKWVDQVAKHRKKELRALGPTRVPVGVRMARYQPGGRFDWHTDDMEVFVQNIDGTLHQSYGLITYVLTLQAPERGGAVQFRVNRQGKVKQLTPKRGDLLLFPMVGCEHRTAPIHEGHMYVVTAPAMVPFAG
ncbi:MAG: hypothetical protein MHM6MM_002940 [Cercozoa sp. M6MM]